MTKKFVSSLAVGKEYLKAELHRLFQGEITASQISGMVENLSEEQFWRLLEALSHTFRLNSVFWHLGKEGSTWFEEHISIKKIKLTGMNPVIDSVTHSSEIQQDPMKFVAYLGQYFTEHPNDDPQGLGQFRLNDRPVPFEKILVKEKEGSFFVIDGLNRLIKFAQQGAESISAFVVYEDELKPSKTRVGDATLWLLRRMYHYVQNPEDKAALLRVTKLLIDHSVDGKDAVKKYWGEYSHRPEDKVLAEQLTQK